mgnify:CR=1 FL=1
MFPSLFPLPFPTPQNATDPVLVKKVVVALHKEYAKQAKRAKDYKNLFSFLMFGVFWMLLLYLQVRVHA